MLKIGQVVIIRQRPTENGESFNPNNIVIKSRKYQSTL